jgi:hypothetical protein
METRFRPAHEVVMRSGGRGGLRGIRALAVAVVALSQVHTSLPHLDFHNIRHHDGTGETCAHHDHLLRWHPGASVASDEAVLHWHWFLPTTSDDPLCDGPGLAMHAHLPDWSASPWDGGPQVATSPRSRPDLSPRLAAGPLGPAVAVLSLDVGGVLPIAGTSGPTDRGASFARRASLTALLQRWVC